MIPYRRSVLAPAQDGEVTATGYPVGGTALEGAVPAPVLSTAGTLKTVPDRSFTRA
ncbi:hypothetical protein DSM112329_01240 [Paraconexibacter sp. AEG42_29]|uniref:Uncharacterized protein n=1 Tax=Paraconexibacter sp. AEG42_29 TaxID=2997339 RepID=A0AAU7ARX6_9ACTN